MLPDDTYLADWFHLICAEYREVPGLRLTEPQVRRLWGLGPVESEALLSTLLDVKFLKRTAQGAYIRADQG